MYFVYFFHRNKITEPTIADAEVGNEPQSDEDQETLKEWLKHNHEPWDTIKVNWRKTCTLRRRDLKSKVVSFDNVLKIWPRYNKPNSFELMDIDFEDSFPDALNKLKYIWPDHVKRIIELAYDEAKASNDKDGMQKYQMQDDTIENNNNFNGLLAFTALFSMLPKSNKSYKQDLERLIRIAPRGTLISSEVRRIAQVLADKKVKEMNPFIIYFQNEEQQPYKFFICINHLIYEVEHFTTALDILFKSYYVFNLKYSEECKVILTFLQHFYYQIFFSQDLNSNVVNVLMCDIDINRGIECENLRC